MTTVRCTSRVRRTLEPGSPRACCPRQYPRTTTGKQTRLIRADVDPRPDGPHVTIYVRPDPHIRPGVDAGRTRAQVDVIAREWRWDSRLNHYTKNLTAWVASRVRGTKPND